MLKINEYQEVRFVSNMVSAMFNTLAGKRVALLGAAFKANTGDIRGSPSLVVAMNYLRSTPRWS